jgi:hypothetical protein
MLSPEANNGAGASIADHTCFEAISLKKREAVN